MRVSFETIYSDNRPQLVAENEELKNVVQGWNQEELKEFDVMEGFKWDFAPAPAQWQNGVSEASVKSVKRHDILRTPNRLLRGSKPCK